MCVKNLTTWLEIVLGGAEVPGPQRFSFVIGASDRAALHEIVRETSEGTSLQRQSLPQTSYEWRSACSQCADGRSKKNCPGGYGLYANPSTQTMLSDVEEKASPLDGCRRELVKYARGSHIGFHSTSQTRSCALRMPRYVTVTLYLHRYRWVCMENSNWESR